MAEKYEEKNQTEHWWRPKFEDLLLKVEKKGGRSNLFEKKYGTKQVTQPNHDENKK